MYSIVLEAKTDPQIVFNTPLNKIGKIKYIQVDNQAGSSITITIQDKFLPTPSAGNPSPSEVTKDKKVITVGAGSTFKEKIEIDILGTCLLVASATDSACKITILYEFE